MLVTKNLLIACVAGLMTSVFAGCAANIEQTNTQTTTNSPAVIIAGPHIPAGARVRVQTTQNIHWTGATGQPIELALTEPLRTEQGVVLAPAGALIRGTISLANSRSFVLLTNASVQTPVGMLPIAGRIRGRALRTAMGVSSIPRENTAPTADDSEDDHTSLTRVRQQHQELPSDGQTDRSVLVAGSSLRLVLSSPVLAPSASVVRTR